MSVEASDLCAIIKVCHKSGVKQLKFNDVEVTFEEVISKLSDVPHETVAAYTPDPPLTREGERLAAELDLGIKPVSVELASQQQQLMEEAEMVDMSITDPVSWEAHCIDRLIHGGRAIDA